MLAEIVDMDPSAVSVGQRVALTWLEAGDLWLPAFTEPSDSL